MFHLGMDWDSMACDKLVIQFQVIILHASIRLCMISCATTGKYFLLCLKVVSNHMVFHFVTSLTFELVSLFKNSKYFIIYFGTSIYFSAFL